jgi:voltage-gated sodium channel
MNEIENIPLKGKPIPWWAQKLISDRFIAWTVLLNAIVLFFDSFPLLHKSYGLSFEELGWVLSVFFVVEITLKCYSLGISRYFSSSGNIFDFIIAGIIAYVLLFNFSNDITVADIILLRLARIVKLIQVLKFVPNQKRVYDGLLRAIRASGAVFLLLFILLFIYSMIGTFFFAHILPEHFGDPLKSMYSVFSIFMVEGWNTIPDVAIENGMENANWIRAFFIFVLISGGVIGMSLANAIFVDEMVMDNNDELEAKLDALITLHQEQSEKFELVHQELQMIKSRLND